MHKIVTLEGKVYITDHEEGAKIEVGDDKLWNSWDRYNSIIKEFEGRKVRITIETVDDD